MDLSVDQWMKDLTLEEKASLCSGKDFWTTKAVERLGIPSWMMTDGPHGLRKQKSGDDAGLLDSTPATCFPSGAGLASSWDRELIQEVGAAIAAEAKAHQVGVVLGPAVNIKRSPLCGRNFEYFGEDPYLAGEMAKHHIAGVQSRGIGTSIKHFAANNQERLRMTINAVVDERTLREIYLTAFEIAVKASQPWTVMCSYNRVNGTYASENRHLLTDILKDEWGHTGVVVTDWGACNDRVAGLRAGQELEMPGSGGQTDAEIVAAVKNGTLPLADLDRAVARLLDLTLKVVKNLDPRAVYDQGAHHALARRAAASTMVLLKNEGGLLPLAGGQTIAFVGAFARHPRYQGAGSSHITPTRMDDAFIEAQAFAPAGTDLVYAPGYDLKNPEPVAALEAEAVAAARKASVAVVFAGLTDAFESEGFDRAHLRIPPAHRSLIEAVRAVQPNTVVVLSNGSPIEMPWAPSVPAILESYLGGQAWGGAVADLLFGRANPSAKLAESFPLRLEDTPSFLNFPGDGTNVEYREGVFVGYRHYDAVDSEVLFPFGHGLSYTSFAYGPLTLDQAEAHEDRPLRVSLEVRNTGRVAGAEVVQLYVEPAAASVLRPRRELKAFARVSLEPGQAQTVTLTLDSRAWAWWSVDEDRWVVESGVYGLAVGASSRDLRQRTAVKVTSARPLTPRCDANTTLGSLAQHPAVGPFIQGVLAKMQSVFGQYEPGTPEFLMFENMVKELPLRNLVRMSGGQFPPALLDLLIAVVEGKAPASALAAALPPS